MYTIHRSSIMRCAGTGTNSFARVNGVNVGFRRLASRSSGLACATGRQGACCASRASVECEVTVRAGASARRSLWSLYGGVLRGERSRRDWGGVAGCSTEARPHGRDGTAAGSDDHDRANDTHDQAVSTDPSISSAASMQEHGTSDVDPRDWERLKGRLARDKRLWAEVWETSTSAATVRLLTRDRALRVLMLEPEDLDGLSVKRKRNPYSQTNDAPKMELYRLDELKAACLRRYGSHEKATEVRVKRFAAREAALETGRRRAKYASGSASKDNLLSALMTTARGGMSRSSRRSAQRRLRVMKREAPVRDTSGSKAVLVAMATNSALFVAKTGAFLLSGSASMLSEAVHSLADVANQALLAIGIRESRKRADAEHPYGYAQEKHIFALISGVGIFFLGCGVSVYHGVSGLFEHEPLESIPLALSVLGVSLLLESYSMSVALKELRADATTAGQTLLQHVREGADPMNIAVLAEDAAAVAGVAIATGCLGLTYWTGNGIYDSIGSITVGCLLGGVAVFLVQRNRNMLVGVSVPAYKLDRVEDVLLRDPVVDGVHDVKAVITGRSSGRFKVEISFNPAALAQRTFQRRGLDKLHAKVLAAEGDLGRFERELISFSADLMDVLGDEVDRLEDIVRNELPEVSHVDIEVV